MAALVGNVGVVEMNEGEWVFIDSSETEGPFYHPPLFHVLLIFFLLSLYRARKVYAES